MTILKEYYEINIKFKSEGMQFMFAYFLIYSENYATFLIDQIKND